MMVIADRLLRHVDLRRPGDVDQGGQLAQPLHRLDHRPRAFRRARLGRHDLLRARSTSWCRGCGAATQLYSLRMVNWHFWLATLGIVIYAAVMWVSGIMQGLMWREYDEQGFLVYSFAETVAAMHPYYVAARLGGAALPRRRAWSWPSTSTMTIRGDVSATKRPIAGTVPPCSRPNRSPTMDILGQTRRHRKQRHAAARRLAARGHASAASSRSRRCSTSRTPSRRWRACGPTRRSNWPAATSTSARAATSATAR